MFHARRFPHIVALLIALLAWSPGSRLNAQNQSDQRARIKQKIASGRADNKVVVKNKAFGAARTEGEASVREGSMSLSLKGRPSRSIRIKIHQKVTKAGINDQSITAVDEATGQESVWSLVDEAGTATLTLNGVDKLRVTTNPDGTVTINGSVYSDETAAGNAGGKALAATDLVPESAQAVAETLDMLMDESASTSRGVIIPIFLFSVTVNSILFFGGMAKAGVI
jgi:hypothetical protein